MSRNLGLYLQDICVCINKIKDYIAGMDYSEFVGDSKTLDAVIHNLLIIGEATKQIPDSLRQQYPEIPWRQVAGLRVELNEQPGVKLTQRWFYGI